MSYPYELDLIMGSEINAVGGNIPLEVITSGAYKEPEDGSKIKPIKNERYVSNSVDAWRVISSNPVEREQISLYYTFDISEIEESSSKDTLRSLLKGMSVSITESTSASYAITKAPTLPTNYEISIDDYKVITITLPSRETIKSAMYFEGNPDPVTDETGTDANISWKEAGANCSTDYPEETRTFTFMSYPYELDLVMGSEMNAVGGNIPMEVITSGAYTEPEDESKVKPVKDKVYVSNTVSAYRVLNTDPLQTEKASVYYTFDISEIEESSSKDTLRSILKGMHVTIEESDSANYQLTEKPTLPENWSISLKEKKVITIEFSSPSEEEWPSLEANSSLYIVGNPDPVTDDSEVSWRVDAQDSDAPASSKEFTFKDR